MSVVVLGIRAYGRVHEHGGEYAETQFAHACFVPLIPVASFWVTNEPGGDGLGLPIKLHGRSVLATYLRCWAPAAAFAVLLIPSLAAAAVGVALLALSAWSWTWRSRRGARTLQGSDFDRVALGNRCDPAWMTDDMRDHLSRKLAAQLAARDGARPPHDVARSGARDVDEAIVAYGSLRLAAVDHPEAADAAARLLASAFDDPARIGGPYREDTAGIAPGIAAAITASAQAHAAATEARTRAPRWYRHRWVQLAGIAVLAAAAITQVADELSTTAVDDIDLSVTSAWSGRRVEVTCDRFEEHPWEVVKQGKPRDRLALCWKGSRALPVEYHPSDRAPGLTLEGRLREVRSVDGEQLIWVTEEPADPLIRAQYYGLYLDSEGRIERRARRLVAGASVAAVLICGAFWLRAFRRRRADRR